MYDIDQISESKRGKLFTFLIAFMALGNVYQLPGIPQLGVGEIMLMVFLPFYFRKEINLFLVKETVGFIAFFVYLFFISLIVMNIFNGPLSKLISVARVAFYWFVIFFLGPNLFSLNFFKKCAFVFSVLLSFFIIIQFFTYAATGFYIPGIIPNAPLNQGGIHGIESIQHYLNMAGYLGFVRPSGFLLEPSHCVQFLFICSILIVNEKDLNPRIRIASFFLTTIAMLIAQSSTGIILTLFSWCYFIFVNKEFFRLRIFMVFLLLIFVVYTLINGFWFDNWALDRLFNILYGSDVDTSSHSRLHNGFNLFAQFPFIYKIFGTGMGSFDLISRTFGFEDSLNYMNCFSFILFSSGFLGMLIWLISLMSFFVSSNREGKSLVLGFFVMSLGCSIFCQPQMVWFFLLILADIRKRNDRYTCVEL